MKKNNNNNNNNNNNKYNNMSIIFITNNAKYKNMLNKKGIILDKNNQIDAKIIYKNIEDIYIGFGIYAYTFPFYKEYDSKITWSSVPIKHIPKNEFEDIITPNQILKFNNYIKNMNDKIITITKDIKDIEFLKLHHQVLCLSYQGG